MDGLERMDKPSRRPVFVTVGLLIVVAVVLFLVMRNKELSDSGLNNKQPELGRLGETPRPTEIREITQGGAKPPAEPQQATSVVKAQSAASFAETATVVTTVGIEETGMAASPSNLSAAEVSSVTNVPQVPVSGVAVVTNPPTPIASPAVALSDEADALFAEGAKDKARDKYMAALEAKPDSALRVALEGKVGSLNVELARTPWAMAEKQEVVVQEGDSVKALARKFGTTVELIVKGNELKRPDVIRPGQHLKVFAGKLEIKVSKSRHDLLVTANGRFFKRYSVGTGRYEKTPVGTFAVSERIPEPPWWRDDGRTVPFGDKENILGTRWMAIKATGNTKEIKGYGIHGTWDNASIGKSESAGCIRLKNSEIEELFELVPIGTPVVIEE